MTKTGAHPPGAIIAKRTAIIISTAILAFFAIVFFLAYLPFASAQEDTGTTDDAFRYRIETDFSNSLERFRSSYGFEPTDSREELEAKYETTSQDDWPDAVDRYLDTIARMNETQDSWSLFRETNGITDTTNDQSIGNGASTDSSQKTDTSSAKNTDTAATPQAVDAFSDNGTVTVEKGASRACTTAAEQQAFDAAALSDGVSKSDVAGFDYNCQDTTVKACSAANGVKATPSEDVINAIGINAHLTWQDTAYGNRSMINKLMKDSGVRHWRVGLNGSNKDQLIELGKAGMSFLIVDTPIDEGYQLAKEINAAVGRTVIEGVEPANEKDGQYGMLCDQVKSLWSKYKGDPATSNIAVLGPSFADWRKGDEMVRACPDIGKYTDYGNVHDYSGTAPESDMGGGRGGSLEQAIATTSRSVGGGPVWSTENGYTMNANPWTGSTPLGAAKLDLRQVLAHLQAGVQRTYFYALLDNGNEAGGDNFGIVDENGTPRPAYKAIQAFIALLEDGTSSSGDSLAYTLNAPSSVNQFLISKGNGVFMLALWQGIPVNGGENHNTDLRNPTVQATLSLPGGADVRQFLPSTKGTSSSGSDSGASEVTLNVPDEVLLVEISNVKGCENTASN